MVQLIRILHVEDDAELADLVKVFLERENVQFTVDTTNNPESAVQMLEQNDYDCIVSDYDMPEQNGLELLKTVRENYNGLPFILFTGKGSEEIASDAISAGVSDYLQKGGGSEQYTLLANRIKTHVENQAAQVELRDRENRLNLFFEQSPLGVIRWDKHFNFAQMNRQAKDILGYDEADLEGRSWEAIVPDSDRKAVRQVVSALLIDKGGYHIINENVRNDGNRIICEWHNRVVTDANEEVVAIYSQFQDITDRKERERELEMYRTMVKAASDVIVTIDDSNEIQTITPAVKDLFGYEPEKLIGEQLTELMTEETASRHNDAFQRYLQTGEKTLDWSSVELEGQHQDGSSLPLTVSFGETTHDGEHLFVGIIRDVTKRKGSLKEL